MAVCHASCLTSLNLKSHLALHVLCDQTFHSAPRQHVRHRDTTEIKTEITGNPNRSRLQECMQVTQHVRLLNLYIYFLTALLLRRLHWKMPSFTSKVVEVDSLVGPRNSLNELAAATCSCQHGDVRYDRRAHCTMFALGPPRC